MNYYLRYTKRQRPIKESEGSRRLRFPYLEMIGKVISLTHRPPLSTQVIFLILISVRVPYCGLKHYVNEKFQ